MPRLASLSAIFLALAVACGAFGAHALRQHVSETDLAIWEKAVLYHLVHALAALVLSLTLAPERFGPSARRIVTLFLVSVCIFSGSLYLLVLLNARWLGMVTPLGGSGFMIGWIWLAIALNRIQKSE